MTLAVYNSAAFETASGVAVAANATVEVRRESDSGLAAIYSDNAGANPITNPSAFADASGRFTFYAAGSPGGYSIEVTSGAENFTLRDVAIGTAAQYDITTFGASLIDDADNAAARVTLDVPSIAELSGHKGIGGLIQSLGTDADHDIDISAGVCADSTYAELITGAAITKQIDAAWAVGTNAGGLDGTESVAGTPDASTWYYIWLIKRSDTDVVDALFSESATAPTMPTSYDFKRLIGAVLTDGSSNIVAFTAYETCGGGLELLWDVPPLDFLHSNTLTTTRREDAVTVPLDFSVIANINAMCWDASANVGVWIYCPDQADTASSLSAGPLSNLRSITTYDVYNQLFVRTSATGTIAAIANVATVDTYRVSTIGFTWARRN